MNEGGGVKKVSSTAISFLSPFVNKQVNSVHLRFSDFVLICVSVCVLSSLVSHVFSLGLLALPWPLSDLTPFQGGYSQTLFKFDRRLWKCFVFSTRSPFDLDSWHRCTSERNSIKNSIFRNYNCFLPPIAARRPPFAHLEQIFGAVFLLVNAEARKTCFNSMFYCFNCSPLSERLHHFHQWWCPSTTTNTAIDCGRLWTKLNREVLITSLNRGVSTCNTLNTPKILLRIRGTCQLPCRHYGALTLALQWCTIFMMVMMIITLSETGALF